MALKRGAAKLELVELHRKQITQEQLEEVECAEVAEGLEGAAGRDRAGDGPGCD